MQAVRWPAGLLVDSFISQPRDRSASEVSGKPLAWLEVRFQSSCRFRADLRPGAPGADRRGRRAALP